MRQKWLLIGGMSKWAKIEKKTNQTGVVVSSGHSEPDQMRQQFGQNFPSPNSKSQNVRIYILGKSYNAPIKLETSGGR